MKVLVNRCFGGFGISQEALIRLIEAGSPHVQKAKDERDEGGFGELWDKYCAPEHRTEIRDGYFTGKGLVPYVYKDGVRYYFDDDRKEARMDLSLIGIVEKLGEAANGSHAELEIVEIPDGIEWEIDEYDGSERIDEVHRSW